MKRGLVVRQIFCVALCLCTVILLVVQFSPRFVQTKTLTDYDGARSYTVTQLQKEEPAAAAVPDSPAEVLTAQSALPATEAETSAVATTQKTEAPTAAHKTQVHAFDPAKKPQSRPVQVQTTEPTEPVTTQKTTLPVADVIQPENTGETTVRPLRFGAQVTTSLPADGSGVVYVLTVTERGFIRCTLGYPSNGPFSEVGWKLTLYEEYDMVGNSNAIAYRRLNILSSGVATDSVTSAAIGVQPGTYRLVLAQNGKFSADDVTVLAEFAAEYDRESEPNDTPARYTELYPGYAVKGASSKYETSTNTDEDWYLFRMPYNGYAHYTFTHDAMDMISVAWQITLYDAGLNPLSFNNADVGKDRVTGEQVGLAKGVYFICIKGRVHSTQDYELKVDCVQADLFEQESNDTFATATPVQSGTVYTGMMNNRAQGIDMDYYAVDLTKAGSLQVTFRHAADPEEDNDGWNISILNAEGQVLHSFISNWMDAVNISPELGVAAGRYYVCIDSDNRYFSGIPYTVEITHTNDTGFEAEPNNTTAKASEAVIGRPVRGSLTQTGLETDTDWFVVHVSADTDVCLTFSHAQVNLDRLGWLVTLTDADGNVFTPMDKNGLPLTDSAGAVRNDLAVNWNQEQASAYYRLRTGDYYIRITAGDYFSSETYTLLLKKS
ncbi:MAG: hypothetical protein IJA31_03530 [Clostridia bacterium]|nr:hypothetical protein [Clostridia bacterium]